MSLAVIDEDEIAGFFVFPYIVDLVELYYKGLVVFVFDAKAKGLGVALVGEVANGFYLFH